MLTEPGHIVDSCNEEVPASDSLAEEADSHEHLPTLPLPEPWAPLSVNIIEEPDVSLITSLASQRLIKRFEFFLVNICYKIMLQVFC